MGNLFECMGKNQQQGMPADEPQMSFISTRSITNLSLPSKYDDTVSVTTAPASISTDSSYKFNWYRLQSIYMETFDKTPNNTIEIQPAVLAAMSTVFDGIKNNIGPMSRKFYECLIEMDKTFPPLFEECAARNQRSITEGKVLVERIRNHIVSMIHVHTIIINSLKNQDRKKVDDIIKLIAISHVLMKVKPTVFNLFDMVMTKFLLRTGFLCEENAEAIVIYFSFITNSIIKNMNIQSADDSNIGYSTIARENYRKLKKWYTFLEDLHKETSQLKELDSTTKVSVVESPSSHSTVPTEILKQDAFLIKHFIKKKINKDSVNE